MIDVLIIGNGGAGLTCAIEAKQTGKSVVVISKTYPTSSQTSQAQGGINAVLNNTKDSIDEHIKDTLKSANNIGDEKCISFMCENSAKSIKWLDDIGVPFSKDKNGNIAQRTLGGATNPRACYSSDYTGLKILHTLYDTALKNEIEFLNEKMILSLIVEDEVVYGVTYLDIKSSEVKEIRAKNVVIASGGYCGIYHKHTTNSTATTGEMLAIAKKAGVVVENLEFVQFHPTTLNKTCVLISESARGEGGYLVTKNGNRFTDELAPRDIVAREIYKKIQNDEEIYLDLRHLGIDKIKEVMPQEYELVKTFASLELDKDLVSIKPSAHYSMGGIKTLLDGTTNIKNLYAIGECASNGVHGANRLGGNSLLEIVTFGRHLGQILANKTNDIEIDMTSKTLEKDKKYIEQLFSNTIKKNSNFYEHKDKLGTMMFKNVGIFRDENNLKNTLNQLKDIKNDFINMGISDKSKIYNTNLKEFIEFTNMVDLAISITQSAINNKTSCGAHFINMIQNEVN